MNNQDSPLSTDTRLLISEQVDLSAADVEQQIARVKRIGERLFGVASCIITFGDATLNFPFNERSLESIESTFCFSLGQPTEVVVINDTRNDQVLSRHRLVVGAPNIRFYAGCPIRDGDQAVVGSIGLVDYLPRDFDEEERQCLLDLATFIERELYVRSITLSQLDLQKKNKSLRRKSLIDPLIGTWNRGAIMRILAIEIVRCAKLGIPISIIVADLDFFKHVNDTYGHPAGDTVLIKVASQLRSCIRRQEALGRYGGEEFLVVLPGSSCATAVAVAERMRLSICSQPEVIGDAVLNLSISSGVASSELFPSDTPEELIKRADVALYAAKNGGRNCVVKALPD